MTKTYSEIRQGAYFTAAITMYKLVEEIHADNFGPDDSEANKRWAQSIVDATYLDAKAIEDRGHTECIADTRAERRLAKYRAQAQRHTTEGRKLKERILAKLT